MWFETLVSLLAVTGNLNTLVRSFIPRLKSHISKMIVFFFNQGLVLKLIPRIFHLF